MTVSIVIPCYNQARFVGEGIASALAQTGPHGIDVIAVDDGSTDGSAAVMAAAAATSARLRVISQPNCGLAAARNAGLDAARGELIIFLDADDRLHPGAVNAAVKSLAAATDAIMTFGRCTLVDEGGQPMLTNLPVVTENFYAELLQRNYIWTPAMAAFRRHVFEAVGRFDSRVDPSADYDLYLRIARHGRIVSHGQLVADYRQHGSSMSRDPVAMLDATLAVLAAQRPYIDAHSEFRRLYWRGRRAWRIFYGEQLVERFRTDLHAGRYRRALSAAGHLLRLYPHGVAHHVLKKGGLILRARASQHPAQAASDTESSRFETEAASARGVRPSLRARRRERHNA